MSGVLLFDWTEGGHHSVYIRRAVEALRTDHRVVVAAPEAERHGVRDLGAEFLSLGDARPPDLPGRGRTEAQRIAEAELALLDLAIRRSDVGRAMHLYTDPVLRHLVRRPRFDVRLDILMFFPMWHYRAEFGNNLSNGEKARALFREALVRRWRHRKDAGVTYTLDEVCAAKWRAHGGRPAAWLPEPPIAASPRGGARAGCVIYGALSRHKGLPLVAAALERHGAGISVTVAGAVAADTATSIDEHLDQMRRGGAHVDFRPWRHTEQEGLELLRGASCAVLAYPRHVGMSRVLVEAASVDTPVVANDFGLLGHLVRAHGLGAAVQCADPDHLGAALRTLAGPDGRPNLGDRLRRFSDRYSPAAFRTALNLDLCAVP